MPTKREREYYQMGFKDGYQTRNREILGLRQETPDPLRGGTVYKEYSSNKPKRKLSSWNKFVKANSKKPRFRYKSGAKRGKVNLKALGVAYRKKKRR